MQSSLYVDAELLYEEGDDAGRQHLHAGLQPQSAHLLLVRAAPVGQCARADARAVGQFLSCH